VNKDPVRRAKLMLLVTFTAWLALVVAAPLSLPPGSVSDLSGRASVIDNSATTDRMAPMPRAIYLLGDLNCHQMAERSLYLNGNQMPFCARDVGIFIGLAAGMLAVLALTPRFALTALLVMVLPIMIDGTVQLTGWYESNNALRVITGVLGGAGASYFLGHFADWVRSGGSAPFLLGRKMSETGRHGKS